MPYVVKINAQSEGFGNYKDQWVRNRWSGQPPGRFFPSNHTGPYPDAEKLTTMKLRITLILLSAMLFYNRSSACSCINIGTFCETIAGSNGMIWEGFQIYYVQVKDKKNSGMDVEVLGVLHGEDRLGETLFFINGAGADCTMGISNFQVGKQYLFAAWKRTSDWALSICGVSYLDVENGKVKGPIAPGVNKVDLDKFNTVANCGGLSGPGVPIGGPGAFFQVFPSPASENVFVRPSTDTLEFNLQLDVFDAIGRRVYRNRQVTFDDGSDFELTVSDWAPGVYFFRVTAWNQRHTFRIVKGQ